MSIVKNTIVNAPEEFRLKRYYYAIEITSLIAIFVFGIVIFFNQEYFPWVRYPLLNFINFMSVFVLQGLFFILRERYKKNIFFSLARYVFIAFFILILYATGGALSAVIFLLIFPLIVSAVDLDATATRNIGIIVTSLFAVIIFADPSYLTDPIIVIRHILNVLLFGLISYYMYMIVKETLRQKYEKEEAKKKLVELTELDRLKTDFLTVAQHQLRTPLAGARWGLDNVLQDLSLSKDTLQIIRTIGEKVQNAMDIVNEILKTAEFGMENFKMTKDSVDLAALIGGILKELSYLIRRKEVSVQFNVAGAFVVEGDRKLLRAAFSNVIDNAIRYSPGGTVTVSLAEEQDRVVFIVADSGIGIKPEDQPYVFERFFRTKAAISLEPNESGVGLYVTKKIIELHHGTITLLSKLGTGTTVAISLPLISRNL